MKTTMAKIASALVAIGFATSAAAQVYGEASYSALTYEEPGADADLGVLGVNAGYEINKYLAVEGMLGFGITDDNVTINVPPPVTVNVDAKHVYGMFLKPKVNLGESFEVYAKLGWARTKIEASAGGFSISDSGSDFAYGVGAQYNLTPKVHLSGGYMNLYDKDGVSIDGWNVGVGYKF